MHEGAAVGAIAPQTRSQSSDLHLSGEIVMSTPPPLPAHNPYAAPMARVDEGAFADLELADRGTRLGAAILDALVLVIPMALLGVGAAIMSPSNGGKMSEAAMVVFGILLAIVFLAVVILNLVWLHRYGQTIGKRILKIKVLRSDGSACTLARYVFTRWLPVTLLGMIPVLGYVVSLADPLMIFREDRRCMHDLIADTIVVRA
jgi:uncharacterized RDD family membrane protein YckC